MKFQQLNNKSIFEPGRLSDLADQVYSGISAKDVKRLTLDDLAKVPEIYGALPLGEYGLDIRDLDSEGEYITPNRHTILGKDVKAITMLMYDKPRTAYTDFGRTTQCHAAQSSGGVPLPLLGLKRFRNLNYKRIYDKFASEIECALKPKEGCTPESGIELRWDPIITTDIEYVWKLDMLLGHTFSSTYFDKTAGEIRWKDAFGLVQVSTLSKDYEPDPTTVRFLRDAGFGNYKGNALTGYGTTKISKVPEGVDKDIVNLYNACSPTMRLFLSQRWCWYGQHRTSDMICSFTNWDELPENIDQVSTGFKGLQPKEVSGTEGGIQALFGL